MKERQLIGMVEYVLGKHGDNEAFAHFLNQPLTLSMFVPCDEDGNPLEEPTADIMNEFGGGFSTNEEQQQLDDLIQQYQAAKERVIFEGFEFHSMGGTQGKHYMLTYKKKPDNYWFIDGGFGMNGYEVFTIEALKKRGLEITLTESTYNKYFK